MKITLMVVGKTTDSSLARGIDDYAARVNRFMPFSIQVIPDLKPAQKRTPQQQKEAEGRLILDAVKPSDHLVLLDERGKHFTSEKFAATLERQMLNNPASNIVFVIGGPYGFSQPVYDRANSLLALSLMTFPHELVRLFFAEQLYRAFTILHGLPYHHA